MLVPAVTKKDELERLFAEKIYSEDYYWYSGDICSNELPQIAATDNIFQYAMLDGEKVVGYLAYCIESATDTVYDFGLLSFDKRNPVIGRDLFSEIERLVKTHRRIEWRMIGGNPVQRHYDKFCERHGGNVVTLHDVRKGPDGKWHDERIYEIISK